MVGTINFRKSIHKKEEVYKRFPFFFTYGMSFPFPLFFCENFIFLFDAKKKKKIESKKHHGMVNLSYVGTWPFLLSFKTTSSSTQGDTEN